MEVVTRIRELQDKLRVVDGPDALSREAQRNATLLFQACTPAGSSVSIP